MDKQAANRLIDQKLQMLELQASQGSQVPAEARCHAVLNQVEHTLGYEGALKK